MPYYVACTAPLLRTHPHTHIHPHNTPVGASVRLGCLVIHDLYEASHTHGHTQSRRWTHAVTQKDTRSHADGHTQISALSTQVFTSIRMHTHRAQRDESKRGGQRWYLCTHGTPEVQDYPLLMRPLFLNFF